MENKNLEKFNHLLNLLESKKYKNIFLQESVKGSFLNILGNFDLYFIFYKKIELLFSLLIDLDKNIYKYINNSANLKIIKTDDFILFYLNKISHLVVRINNDLVNHKSVFHSYHYISDIDHEVFLKASICKYYKVEFLDLKNICIVDYSFFRLSNHFKDEKIFKKLANDLLKKVLDNDDFLFLISDFKSFHNNYNKKLTKKEIYILWYIFSIFKVYRNNHLIRPNLLPDLLKKFLSIFFSYNINKNSKLYIIRNSHEILSFFALKDTKNDKEKMFISFNTKDYLKGFNIGRYLFDKVVYGKINSKINIVADAGLELAQNYLENYSFCFYDVKEPDIKNNIYIKIVKSKNITNNIFFNHEKYHHKDIIRLKNKFKDVDSIRFIKEIKSLTNENIYKELDLYVNKKGYCVTRYFHHNHNLYIAFEKLPNGIVK